MQEGWIQQMRELESAAGGLKGTTTANPKCTRWRWEGTADASNGGTSIGCNEDESAL